MRTPILTALATTAVLAIAGAQAVPASVAPDTVSPGRLDVAAPVAAACPAFSWTEQPGSGAYELVVYQLPEEGSSSTVEEPTLQTSLPGGALSWTPDRTECLEPGKGYAWLVRAVSDGEAGPWSEPRLFSVPEGPSTEEVAAAVEILRRSFAEQEVEDFPKRQGRRATAVPSRKPASGPRSSAEKSALDAATTAIRGELPATTGNTIGVAGVTSSPDGAGIAAANADPAGGPDLLLDGAAQGVPDTVLTESGLLRNSASAVGFDFSNPSGPMTVTLTGVPLVTTLTDRDTLGGLSCPAGQVAKFDGGSWICSVDADTVGGLSCAADEFPRFDGGAWVCTAYSAETLTAANPGQPHSLRLGPEPSESGKRRLSWAMDDLAGVASFVVYQSDQAITKANKSTVAATVTGDLHTTVRLFPGSGKQHFRVEARNLLGEAGPLSLELVVDTAPRLAYRADQETDGVFELFVVPAAGGSSTKVNDPLFSFSDVTRFAWSPDGTRFAYAADLNTDNVRELYVVAATGGGATIVSDPNNLGDFGVLDFDWSPDGTRLAYRTLLDTVDFLLELYVVAAAGGESTKINDPLVSGGGVGDFAWSPDGTRLAYRADQETHQIRELYVAPATGGGSTKVNDPFVAGGSIDGGSNFAWSPDGTHLAYRADQETDGVFELFVAPATGGGSTKSSEGFVSNGRLAWSPDGTRLAYVADGKLFVAPPTGSTSIKANGALVAGGAVSDFVWSPDGTRIAYRADQETDQVFELFVTPATGGGAIKLNNPLIGTGDVQNGYAWSPDGAWLAYRADQDVDEVFELFAAPATGGGAIRVNAPLVSGGNVFSDFAWSPDGSRLAYRADQETDGVTELYAAFATGGGITEANDSLTPGGGVGGFAWSPLGSD